MNKYRKKPVVIEAIQYQPHDNCGQVNEFMGEAFDTDQCDNELEERMAIETLEGTMWASPGDWIIKGVQGEFYPCKPDIFAATYEIIADATSTPPTGAEDE